VLFHSAILFSFLFVCLLVSQLVCLFVCSLFNFLCSGSLFVHSLLYQRADKTAQDCLALGEKCADIPGQRGEQGGVGEDGGYAGHSGKSERVAVVGH